MGKIVYKKPDLFDKGIGVFMRLNQDYFKNGIADKADTKYLVKAHYPVYSSEKRKLILGEETEEKYFKLLKLKKEENTLVFTNSARRLSIIVELQKIKNKSVEETEFIEFNDRENDIENLLQTACALMNTKSGTIILGQNQAMNDKTDKNNILEMDYIIKRLIEGNFKTKVFLILKKDLNQIRFLDQFGNVLDLDRSFL